ncbi:MAG TPA: DUF3347 domain-containing protein [Verrucomicrobiae bacterium]|nr:DUF3347 domain-containing protein [Verrucomicrobiae bacterium]
MKAQIFVLSIFAAGLIAAPTLPAQAQGCCGGSGMCDMSNCPMSGRDSSSTAQLAQPATVAGQQSQSFTCVFNNYLHMETALANDSLVGVADDGQAIAKTVNNDTANTFPATVAQQADAVAHASDLESARAAFKPLSDSLIKYLADHNEKDAYVKVYCPMARASWLQADKNVKNPYMGQAMSGCGEIQN